MAEIGVFDAQIEHFNPNNPFAGDEKNPVQFYMGVMPDALRTETEGRPIYKDEEFIRIFNSKDNIIDRPVRDSDKQRWPRQYAAWKNTGESIPGASGTRLEHWPCMTRAQVEEFKYFKIFTVEQLADMPDSVGVGIMGLQKLKTQAQAYVETAKGQVPIQRMSEELEAKQLQINELNSEIRRINQLLEKLSKQAA